MTDPREEKSERRTATVDRRTGFQDIRDPISNKLILRFDARRCIVEIKLFRHREPVRVDLKPYLDDVTDP